MAQIPNLYTFGQVQVDTSDIADLQGKLLAQRQAKEEALNKYFEKQMGSLSREGIADNDVKDYDKSISELKNYWKQNAQNIRRGGQSKIDFDNKVQEVKDLVYKSKEKKKELLEANKLRLDGKINTDDDLFVIQQMEKPVKDPSRMKADGSPYSFKDFGTFVQPFDPNKRKSFFAVVSEGIEPSAEKSIKKRTLPGGDIEETFEYSYTPQQLKFMQDKAALSLTTDGVAKNYYQKLLANPSDPNNANTLAKLNEAWNNSGLHKGDTMDSPEDLAMADVLLEFYSRPKPTKPKTYNISKTGGAGGGGPKDKWEDYYFLDKYTPVPIGNTGKQGIEATSVSAAQRKILDNLKIVPFYDVQSGKDYYIYDKPGQWRGEDGQIVTNDDVAEVSAPQELKRTRKAGGGKKVVKY